MFVLSRHVSLAGRSRWLSTALLVTALSVSSAPALAQTAEREQPATTNASQADCTTLHFGLSNPHPGDSLQAGRYVLEGFAFDTAATIQQGAGIDRVEIFLDDRNQGGLHLGSVSPGQNNATVLATTPFAVGSFSLEVTLPERSGGHTLSAYARSSVTGTERMLSVPIQVGEDVEDIMPAVSPAVSAPEATCGTGVSPQTTAAPTASPAAVAPAPSAAATAVPATTAPLHVTLFNPTAGGLLQPGGYELEGLALDSRSTQGGGVDRVQVFLGDRDAGGLLLGQAILGQSMPEGTLSPAGGFNLLVELPNQNAGPSLYTYARSAVTGEETVVRTPVQIGTLAE